MNRPIDAAPGIGAPIPPADGVSDLREPQGPQVRFDALTDEMMIFRPYRGVNYSPFRLPNLNPQEFFAGLGDAVPEGLLIADGQEMPQPMLDATVRRADSTQLTGVAMVAHRYREHGGVRRFLVLELSSRYPDKVRAMQKIQLESDTRKPGELHFHRVALVDPNSETAGYDRTPDVPATPLQAWTFIARARGLFEAWSEENPERVARVTGSQPQAPASTSPEK